MASTSSVSITICFPPYIYRGDTWAGKGTKTGNHYSSREKDMTWDVLPVCKFKRCLFTWLCNYLVISSYLGFLYITGQQQAASLSVKRSCFAADRFVGFSVKPDGTWFSGCHCGCINSHSHTYPLAKTQVESKDWGEGKMAHRQAERRSSVYAQTWTTVVHETKTNDHAFIQKC